MGSIIAVIIAVLNNRSLFLFANVKMLGEKKVQHISWYIRVGEGKEDKTAFVKINK